MNRQHTESATPRGGRRPTGRGRFDPSALVVAARHLQVDGAWVATLVVTGYPREVQPGWLAPLTTHPGLVDVSLHIDPVDPAVAAGRLRRQLARLESGRRHTAEHGRLLDPHVEAATEDAYELSARVARGEGRLYTVTLTLTVHAATADELDEDVAAVRALTTSLLLDARPTTYRALHAWHTGLPLGLNRLGGERPGGGRVMDTAALAAAFPFTSPDLPGGDGPNGDGPGGVLYGHNLGSQGLVFWDRFGCDNYNSVVLGRSGSGKSYLVKLELLRSLYRGVDAQVIDPEDEYSRLGVAVGGTVVRPGAPGVRLNPFDLPIHTHPGTGARTAAPDALARRVLFLHTFLAVALGTTPTATERAVLDAAITATYRYAGITDDPRTWTRPAPLLRDLHATLATPDRLHQEEAPGGDHGSPEAHLEADAGEPVTPSGKEPVGENGLAEVAASLATRLRPFVDGAYAGLFDGPTSTPPHGHLVVWSLRELADEVKPLATLLVLDAIWRTVTHPHDRRPRLITVDEAWLLLQHPDGAQFLLRAAKSGRKYWTGLTVATQDTTDVLGTDLGKAVLTNAATQILMRQAPQAIDHVSTVFDLSAGERAFLLAAERGDGLLLAGQHRAAFTATASAFEDSLITTDPTQTAHQTATAPEWIDLDHPDHHRDQGDWGGQPW
ncbi:VirB4 family type IV secretion system protein [Pseudonocardia nigra]|uniref:VirB4 family type IV secretion system protein n=1 Tax=Pseudonocardia nigra TaxID=1921578 RepID=UPI001C607943|nr:DUF87 domain-containing protein [Pseudonocardia nigra]